jgi:RimJ/RimL family protein N-acetyltransferase
MNPVYLRALEGDDLARTYQWHNDHELYKTIGVFHYVSRATDEEWLRKKSAFSNQELNLAICLTETGQHIGNIYIHDIDWVARHGELRIFIGDPSQRSKGYGRAAIELVAKHVFEDLGLARLYLFVLADNEAAVRAYEKSSFVCEGRLRKHAFVGGEYKDLLVMGLCLDDVKANRKAEG